MKKVSSQPIMESDEMQNVELHRAESMVQSPTEDENESLPKNQIVTRSLSSKAADCCTFIRGLKIEVVMFMYMFSSVLRMVSTTTMIMDKVCLVHYQFTPEECKNLSGYPLKRNQVERVTNNYNIGHSMISMLPAAIIAAFIGSWSDKYGRKMPLIIALVGVILDGLGTSLCAAFFYSRVEFFLMVAIFSGLSGGMISVMTVLYSYASDITTFGQRTMKYAVMEMAFGLAMPLGQLIGGQLFKYAGYAAVFLMSTGGHLFALGWVLFVLKETKGLENRDTWSVKLRNLFSLDPVKGSIKATMKTRPNKGKEQILLLILAMSITILAYASAGGISFLYAQHQYRWDNTQYSTVSATFSIIGIFFIMAIVPIFKRLKLGDGVLGIVGCSSILAKNITLGFSVTPGLYFLAHLLGLLGGVANLGGRSRISKVTSKDDLGKVFSFLTTAESLLPIIASAIVGQIFNASLGVFPGLVFLGIGTLMGIPVVIYFWICRLPAVDYEEMHNNTQEEGDVDTKEKELEIIEKSEQKLKF